MQPEGLLGIHLNTQYAFPAQIPDTLSPEQRFAVQTLALYTGDLGGANHLQGTKPETVGFALADSPRWSAAAWIYDKFQSKTDNHGLAEDALTRDVMLDAISLYWFTNSAASSARIYWENRSSTFAGPKLTLPVAVTVFPKDIPRLPRSWIERHLQQSDPLRRGRQGRALRGLGTARDPGQRDPHRPAHPSFLTLGCCTDIKNGQFPGRNWPLS